MIDIKRLRENLEEMRRAIHLRSVDPSKTDLDRWLALDQRRRQLKAALDACNAEKKAADRLWRDDPEAARLRGQELRQQSRELEQQLTDATREWQQILDWLPNWPHPDMPKGEGEGDNVEECAWIPGTGYLDRTQLGTGTHTASLMPRRPCHADGDDFEPLHHLDLGERLGGLDTAQAGAVSGTRFAYILGDTARLYHGLQQVLVERLLSEGFEPIIPPLLVRERALYGTSHFPEGRDQVYRIASDNVEEGNQLFLVGSSEPSNFSYFMDRVLPEAELPVRLFASTPCFRS
ncbi:MAG: hypothetical protein ACRDJ9_35160, partial [Dehalococcoidia bacterium]